MTLSGPWRVGIVVVVLLAISLSWKYNGINRLRAHDDHRFKNELVATLRAQGYAVAVASGGWWEAGLVTARRDGCTVQLRNAGVFGQDRDTTNRSRMTAGPVSYYRNGTVSHDYPRFRSELAWRVQRELGRIGLAIPISPTLAVAASAACAPDPQSLADLQLHMMNTIPDRGTAAARRPG